MYEVRKTFEFAGAHSLALDYNSPCNRLHGHNWIVTVCCSSEELNECGMIVDFKRIKHIWDNCVKPDLDHRNLNDLKLKENRYIAPTAENIAEWIYTQFRTRGILCHRVEVRESRDNLAIYHGPK